MYRPLCRGAVRAAAGGRASKTGDASRIVPGGSSRLASGSATAVVPASSFAVAAEDAAPPRRRWSRWNDDARTAAAAALWAAAGGVAAGGLAYSRWNSDRDFSARCERVSECAKKSDDDESGTVAAEAKESDLPVLATSGRYHQMAGAENQVDEFVQTAREVVESGVNRLQRQTNVQQTCKANGDSGGRTTEEGSGVLRKASEARTTTARNFKVLAAQLDAKNEREKVQLARLLRELHALASESGDGASSSSSVVTASGGVETASDASVSGKESGSESSRDDDAGRQMLRLQDPDSLTPEQAMAFVEAFKRGAGFDVGSLSALFRAATRTLKRDPSLVDLRDKETVTVVGDLHGSLPCLVNTLHAIGDIGREDRAVVFNGDFVDRGPQSLEVVLTLLLLKLAYPTRVFLNRGNHEDSFLSTVYGFEDELRDKYGDDRLDLLWGELSNIFSALPVCCVTRNAAILHGGLPSDTFLLDEVAAISADERCRARSVLEPRNDTERLLQGIFWSDPVDEEGLRPNEARGAGNAFGPDVARRFLDRHGLMYLIRSHEPLEEGWTAMDCGDGRFVVTVFSDASYDGCESGAVVDLHGDGRVLPAQVPQLDPVASAKEGEGEGRVLETLVGMIASNKRGLADAFEAVAPAAAGGVLTRRRWADVMAEALDLPEVDWMAVQPSLAPTTLEQSSDDDGGGDGGGNGGRGSSVSSPGGTRDTGMIDWRRFLDLHAVALSSGGGGDDAAVQTLYANHAMLLTVFRFLDTDGNGRVDRQEFRTGVNLLNRRLPEDQRLGDPEGLFDTLDLDGSGEIELDEFSEAFKVL